MTASTRFDAGNSSAADPVDRVGSRLVLTVVIVALSLVVLAMSQVTTLAGLLALVTLTRGFGQSALSVVSLALVGKWFSRRLPLAMGVAQGIASVLHRIGGLDPLVFATAPTVLAVAALVASYIPARRATLLRPIDALRTE